MTLNLKVVLWDLPFKDLTEVVEEKRKVLLWETARGVPTVA